MSTGDSARENANFVRGVAEIIGLHKPGTSALDVGAGQGFYGELLRDLAVQVDALEVHPPLVEALGQSMNYRAIYHSDARDFPLYYKYDLVIFGDVLEHMELDEALKVFERAKTSARWVLVSVPIVHYEQGSIDGNDHEVHLIPDAHIDLIPRLGDPALKVEYEITGSYLYRGALRSWA